MALPTNVIKCKFCNWTTRKYGFGSNPEKAFQKLLKHIDESHPAQSELIEDMRRASDARLQDEQERFNGEG